MSRFIVIDKKYTDDADIAALVEFLQSWQIPTSGVLDDLRGAASAVAADYACAIDCMDHEDEANESRELLDDLQRSMAIV